MGARQSKRVEISGTSKKSDVENGAIVSTEEKLEKIEEGETVASKTNINGLTNTAEQQQETATSDAEVAAVPETTPSKEVDIQNESVTEVAASPENPSDAEATSPTSPTEDSSKEQEPAVSPSEATTTEEGASSTNEKKKKQKKLKKWSFRSFSFSKRDKQKPVASKEEPKQQEALPEGNEAVSQAEQQQQNDDDAEKTKKAEEEDKKKKEDLVPPPLPTSPPPTPAEEVAVVATSVTSVSAAAAVPVKEESQIVPEGDVDTSGGGEALAEPLEEGELEESTTTTTSTTTVKTSITTTVNGETTTLTNGTNGTVESNGEVENGDLPSPVCELKAPIDVESVTAKIDSLKLQIATDTVELQSHAQNGFGDHSLNGDCNGTEMNGSSDCHVATDSVVSVDHGDASADVSAD